MKKVYQSKKDILVFLMLTFACVLGVSAYNAIEEGEGIASWTNTIVLLIVFLLSSFLYYPTKYTIDGSNLIVRSGFQRMTIPIAEITYVRRSRNVLASPALSLDRLEIVFSSPADSVLISPCRKRDFLNDLKVVNPNIDVSKA